MCPLSLGGRTCQQWRGIRHEGTLLPVTDMPWSETQAFRPLHSTVLGQFQDSLSQGQKATQELGLEPFLTPGMIWLPPRVLSQGWLVGVRNGRLLVTRMTLPVLEVTHQKLAPCSARPSTL
jgi:hypothetical protein